MFVKLDIPDSQKSALNMLVLKDMWRKYGHKSGKQKSNWVEGLMHEIDPYRFYLEWDVPADIDLPVIIDIVKFLKSCPGLPELKLVFPNGIKFIIPQGERAVEAYYRFKEEV